MGAGRAGFSLDHNQSSTDTFFVDLKNYKNHSQKITKDNGMMLSLEQFQNHMKDPEAMILDTRLWSDFQAGHIPNSLFIPNHFVGGAGEEGGMFRKWSDWVLPRNRKLLLVCDMEKQEHINIMTWLTQLGFSNILGNLEGGFDTWKNAGLESEVDEYYMPKDLLEQGVFDLGNSDVQVLDVRTPAEWRNDGVAPNAKLLELANLTKTWGPDSDNKSLDKTKTTYFQCRAGIRSLVAMSWLRIHGWKDVRNIIGGRNQMAKDGVELGDATEDQYVNPNGDTK